MEGLLIGLLAVAGLIALVVVAVSRGGDRTISGSGDTTRADAEARARSSGIDHLNPGA